MCADSTFQFLYIMLNEARNNKHISSDHADRVTLHIPYTDDDHYISLLSLVVANQSLISSSGKAHSCRLTGDIPRWTDDVIA